MHLLSFLYAIILCPFFHFFHALFFFHHISLFPFVHAFHFIPSCIPSLPLFFSFINSILLSFSDSFILQYLFPSFPFIHLIFSLPSFLSFLSISLFHSFIVVPFLYPSFLSFILFSSLSYTFLPPFNHSIVPSSHSFIPHLFSPRQEARNTTSNLSTLKKHYTPHQPQRSLHVYTLSMTTQC